MTLADPPPPIMEFSIMDFFLNPSLNNEIILDTINDTFVGQMLHSVMDVIGGRPHDHQFGTNT